MFHMLKRFLEIMKSIEHALLDINKGSMFLDRHEVDLIESLIEPLDIIEACSRKLCSRDVNIAEADRIFEYELRELQKLKSDIGQRFAEEIEYRITERRLKTAATLLAYLENPMFQSSIKNPTLEYANKTEIQRLARDVLLRLFPMEDKSGQSKVRCNVIIL